MLRGIVQHDTLNEVNIRLSDGSKAFDYYGYTNIVLKILKPDGTAYVDSVGENVIATSPEDGIVTVYLKGQATAAAGICQLVLEIYAGEDKMTTARLHYEVFEELGVGIDSQSEDYMPVFQNLMAEMSEIKEDAAVASGYAARAEAAAGNAEMWAKASQDIAESDFATRAELEAVRAGAAPAGYGLGEATAKIVRDANAIEKSGWYRCDENMPNAEWWYGEHTCFTDGYAYQEFRQSANNNRVCRQKIAGVWGKWEWMNPPMMLDVEYRTTERYMGRTVYTKMVNFGPNTNGKTMAVAYDVYQNVRCEAQAGGSSTYPWVRFQNDVDWNCAFWTDRVKITDTTDENYGKYACIIRCFTGTSGSGSYETNFVRVWYTKTTDT